MDILRYIFLLLSLILFVQCKKIQNFAKNSILEINDNFNLISKQGKVLENGFEIQNEDFYEDCGTIGKKCWGIFYHPTSTGDCVAEKNCNFAFSIKDNGDLIDFHYLKRISDQPGSIRYNDEFMKMFIGYVPIKDSKDFLDQLDCEKEPTIDLFKVFAYSKESNNPHTELSSQVHMIQFAKNSLKEMCRQSLEPEPNSDKMYNLKSYMEKYALFEASFFYQNEHFYFDLESIVFETTDGIFHSRKDEASAVGDVDFYDKCDFSAQKICFGICDQDCVKNKNCTVLMTVRETIDEFAIQMSARSGENAETDKYYYAFTLATFKNLGETSIRECRRPTLNDFKLFIYTDFEPPETTHGFFSASIWVEKKRIIERCEENNHQELNNPLDLSVFYINHYMVSVHHPDLDRNLTGVEPTSFKSVDDVFYTNIQI